MSGIRRAVSTGRVVAASVVATLAAGLPAGTTGSSGPTILWSVRAEARGTPAADGETTYFLSRRHEVRAVDVRSGGTRWRVRTGSEGADTMGSRVVLSNNRVIVGDYDVFAFEATTGAAQWTYRPATGFAAGAYLGVSLEGVVYAGSADGFLHAIAVRTGRPVWIRRVAPRATVFAPVVHGRKIFVSYTRHVIPARGGLAAFDATDGRELWRREFLPWHAVDLPRGAAGEPLVVDDLVVAGSQDGTIVGLELETGVWRWAIPPLRHRPEPLRYRPDEGESAVVSQDFRPLVRVGHAIVAGSLTGRIVAYDLGTRQEIWRTAPVSSSVAFGMTADAAALYVPYLSGDLVAIAAADGREKWRTGGVSAGFTWTPLIYDSRLFVAGSAAGLVALLP